MKISEGMPRPYPVFAVDCLADPWILWFNLAHEKKKLGLLKNAYFLFLKLFMLMFEKYK